MTYDGVQTSDNISNCFYAGYSLVETTDQLIYIFENAGKNAGAYHWFGFAVEEPIHFALNSTVFYQ